MNGWTKLHARTAESEHLNSIIDRDPDAAVLFFLMMSRAGVWGRFPANPKLLKARVAPLSERLSSERIAKVLPLLQETPPGGTAGLIQQYDHDGVLYLVITNHLRYNQENQWHRVGEPEFPPPPGWTPPPTLYQYLDKVKQGKFRDKVFEVECERFGVDLSKANGGGRIVAAPKEPITPPPPKARVKPAAEAETTKPKRVRRVKPEEHPQDQADHTALLDALEAAYPHYRETRLRGLLAVYLGLLSQPGCTVNEAQLVTALSDEPPLAGGTPEKYMLHVQSLFRDTNNEPDTPKLPPERIAEIDADQEAEAVAQLQAARRQRLAEYDIPVEVDELWQAAQRILRTQLNWSFWLSTCWLQSVAGGVAKLLVPANAISRVAPLESAITEALTGAGAEVDSLEWQRIPDPGDERQRDEAIQQARAYVDDCEAYADDPEALADALKSMFGNELANIAARAVTGAADSE